MGRRGELPVCLRGSQLGTPNQVNVSVAAGRGVGRGFTEGIARLENIAKMCEGLVVE
jgi:hypothetical protein